VHVTLAHTGLQRHGALAATWCPYGPAADFPPDQREDDALCLTFETAPLEDRLELLGHPRLRLTVAADQPLAFAVARLCDVAPDGTSLLLSRGALNLAHRDSHEHPVPLIPRESVEVDIELDALGHAVPTGHRLRLALSSTYWPWLWPSPEAVTLTITAGPGSWLELPVRPLGAPDGDVRAYGSPERAPGLEVEQLEEEEAFHLIARDVVSGRVTMTLNQDGGGRVRQVATGIELGELARDRFTIVEGDPLSAHMESERQVSLARGDRRAEVRTRSTMSCDATRFHLTDTLEAFDDDERIFERTWERSISRDHV
jgi:hypothetical protein